MNTPERGILLLHGKNIGNTLYGSTFDTTGKKYVIGKPVINLQANYYKPNQTKWDSVQAHTGTTDRTNWNDMIMCEWIKVLSGKMSLGSYKCSKHAADELFSLDTTSAASYGNLWVPDSWNNVGTHTGMDKCWKPYWCITVQMGKSCTHQAQIDKKF